MRKKGTKEKMQNRILSVFLAVTILFSALPVNALAEGDGATQEEGTEYTSVAEETQARAGVSGTAPGSGEQMSVVISENVGSSQSTSPEQSDAVTSEDADLSHGFSSEQLNASVSGENDAVSGAEETEDTGESPVQVLADEGTSAGISAIDVLNTLAGKTDEASVTVDGMQITVDAGGLVLLSNCDMDFEGYTIFLSTLSGGYADLTKKITIDDTTYTFQGLGSDSQSFSGTIQSQDSKYGMTLNVPFFKRVDVSKAKLVNLQAFIIKRNNETSALLAENICGEANVSWSSLTVEAEKYSITVGGTTTEYLPGELIGTMTEGASLSLGVVTYETGATASHASGNAGLLCNTMNENSSLAVGSLTVSSDVSITADSGNAGGLVGRMESGARLTVNDGVDTSVTISSNFIITGQNAGGLIGSGVNVKLDGAQVTINGATVKGSTSAGGLIGSYTTGASGFTSYDGSEASTLKVNNIHLETTVDKAYAGGLFGVLELTRDFSISNASVTSTIAGNKAYYGGLIGQVKGNSADSLRALTISGTSEPNTSTSVNLNGYAGAIAIIGNDNNTPAYVQITDTFAPSFSGVDKSGCFGGAVSYLKIASVLEMNATFAPIGCTNIPKGGCVLGDAARSSTLCLAGTTNLSSSQFNNNNLSNVDIANSMGQIVGTQESALIYAKSDWTLIRQKDAQQLDDIGTYGSVIRLGGNMGMGTPSDTSGLSASLISQNETTHKTEFLDSAKNALSGDTFMISSADQLALLAIEEQTKCAFQIYGSGEDYYFKTNPSKYITLGANISLANTGIIGLQRDIAVGYAYAGTLDGKYHTLTIAAGEIYGFRGNANTAASADTVGSGQIHGHTQVGFFSTASASMKDLTVNGDINLYFRTKTTDTSTTYLAGGLVAKNTAASTYTNVATSINIQYQGTAGGSIGGLVGLGTALTLTDCTGSAEINIGGSDVYAGGLIGQYTGESLSVSGTTLKGSMEANGAAHARLGGLVSRIAKGSYDVVNVTLTDITVDGQTITGTGLKGSTVNNVPIPTSCGGLLGYEWNNASVTFGNKASHSNGLTVTGSSSVTVDGATETAGLVYAATGYWQVNDINLEKLSVTSDTGDLGLLVCRGWRRDVPTTTGTTTKPYLLYLEETGYQAYAIKENGVSITNSSGVFDEWVVYTCESKETITNNGNSVISIATSTSTTDSENRVEGVRVGVDPTTENCTSYQNRTDYGKTANANPNARYYYDLDVIRAAAQSATQNSLANTPGELVLWAVWRYVEKTNGDKSNIADYFSTDDIRGASMTGDGNLIDLTGYAYYPVTVDGFNLSVTNINVKFADQEIEDAEKTTGNSLDSLNRTTVGTTSEHTQHYLLHSGLLLNYQNSTAGSDVTMSVSNVTFQGTIGKGPNGGSGTLICGQLGGYTHATSPKYAKLNIQGVTLSGVSVNAYKTSADTDYAPLLVNRVGSYSSLSAQNVTTSNYSNDTSAGNPAATSLIGHVGSDTATNITLAFSQNIDLSGRKTGSIFSHATLLESFQYQSGGSGYYRFYEGDTFTYGREISESVENKDLQLWYSRRNPEDQLVKVTDGSTTVFQDYLPYVCKPYTDGEDKYHELEVNLASPDLTVGCGTYDDPYIISSPEQLMRAADFINGNSPQTGWKVNKVTNAEEIETGENNNHTTFVVGDNWDNDAMRTYMRGAYYQITTDLELSNFSGFGSVDNPFVGVIDGRKPTDGSDPSAESKPSVEIKNAGSGFINVSYGSVVRNLTIIYTGTKTLDSLPENVDPNNSHTVYANSYFGGIIGTVMGGDSLIDNVTVNMSEFTITTSYDLQCAGGFVGLIQGGGVVFSNMGSQSGYTGSATSYYVDKYIGRVLDGYAINEVEGSSVTFGGKNYSIPNISSETSIAWNSGNISIGNAQQMMIFTDIINSGAASGGSALAYSSGARTRNADYSKIGNIGDAADTAFVASRKDDAKLGTENYPYLISKYAGGEGGFWNACTSENGITIEFTQESSIDLSPYGNGYRGIGGRYHCNANGGTLTNNTPKINTVTGNGVSLHVKNDISEYRADNFYANSVGGLFNVLRHKGATIEKVNVWGMVKVYAGLVAANEGVESKYLSRAPVGGIIGRDYCEIDTEKEVKLSHVSFGSKSEDSTVYGECVTGGLIGSSGSTATTVLKNNSNNHTILLLENCSYQKVTIVGGICAGGFVGSIIPNYGSFATYNAAIKPGSTRLIQWNESIKFGMDSKIQNLFFSASGSNGVGGLIGLSCAPFTIKGDGKASVVLNGVLLHGGKSSNKGRIGGVVGFAPNNNAIDCKITNIKLEELTVGNSSTYDDNTGGFIGTWYSKGSLVISESSIKSSTIQGEGNGGIVGYAGNNGTVYVKNVILDGNKIISRGGASSEFYSGGLGGNISIDFYGQNILLKNTEYIYNTSNKSDRIGRLFGKGDKARLLGITIQQNSDQALPAKDIYNKTYPTDYGATNYVVYADYSNTVTTPAGIADEPSQAVPGITDGLHGDTVKPNTVFNAVKDSNTYYQNLSAAGIDKTTFAVVESTYKVQQDTELSDNEDFPVVLIDGDASVLKQYLNAATNGGFDSVRACKKVAVDISRYHYNSSSHEFSIANETEYPATLIYHSSTGEFTTTAQYDNQKDTFTLVTVTMIGYDENDPFVLHIPVIVRRMLQIDFMATMSSGTVFNKLDSFYSETKNHALASKGENITGYLTFHYNSNASDTDNPASYDWQSYMEGGGDLLGYYKKTVDTGTNPLPAGTKITLIDCQNGDRRYYASVGEGKSSYLELFNGGNLTFTASDGSAFAPASLSDLLQITAETADDAATVKWVKPENKTGATVKDKDGNYYRLYDETKDTAIKDLYTLTVGNSSPKENYFVVISVPNKENHRLTMDKTGMTWNESTTSPPLEMHQVHRYDPTRTDPKEGNSEASFNYLDNYRQNLVYNTEAGNEQVQTTSAKVQIPISLTNKVEFTKENYNPNDPLYQKLVIALKKTEEGATTTVGIPSDAVAVDADTGTRGNAVKLYAYYLDSSGQKQYCTLSEEGEVVFSDEKTPATSYSWSGSADSGEMVLPFAAKNGDSYQYINLAALREASGGTFFLETETTLELSMASILNNNTIPYDSASGELVNFTQVDATSILSFTESGLSYSTLKANVTGNKKYYLNTSRDAILRLDYRNIDQLGINAREEQSAVIDTLLTLDLSNMEGFTSDINSFKTLSEADTVQFTLSLKQKGNEGYSDVSIDSYMTGAAITDGSITDGSELPDCTIALEMNDSGKKVYTITLHKNDDGTYPYYNAQSGMFTIPLSFTVNMDVKEYANYRICAGVALQKDNVPQDLSVNVSSAFLTYTYAKINVNGYWE